MPDVMQGDGDAVVTKQLNIPVLLDLVLMGEAGINNVKNAIDEALAG